MQTYFGMMVLWFICFCGLLGWFIQLAAKKADPDGRVKQAARGWIIGWILRRLK